MGSKVNGINQIGSAERHPEKAGVGGSSPSLATTFSISYNCRSRSFCSILFQFQNQACRNLPRLRMDYNAPARSPISDDAFNPIKYHPCTHLSYWLQKKLSGVAKPRRTAVAGNYEMRLKLYFNAPARARETNPPSAM